jgi:hypothetical protein
MSSKQNSGRLIPAKYLNDLLDSKCGADMLGWKLFPNAKEVAESFGCYYAVGQHLQQWGLDWKNANTTVVVVGDGSTPRTGAVFALRSKWSAISIDPEMKDKSWPVDRLTTIKKRIQDYHIKIDGTAIIVHCHSHARLDESLKSIQADRRIIVAMPCCVPQFVEGKPHHIEYRDKYIPGPHNLIKIWNEV